jgi:hypothetical protein
MDEDGVELTREPRGPHVPFDVLALGIQGAAHGQHPAGPIHQQHLETRLHVRRVVSAAAAELEQGARRYGACGRQRVRVKGRLLQVVGGRRHERPP